MFAEDIIASRYEDFEDEGYYTLVELWSTWEDDVFIVRKTDQDNECFFEKLVDRMKLGQYGFEYDTEGEDMAEWN